MSEKDKKILLLLAEAKLRVAGSIILVAMFFTVWIVVRPTGQTQREAEKMFFCGNVSVPVAFRTDTFYLKELRSHFGHHLDLIRGEKLFRANCTPCHKMDRDMTGPGIKGILDRAPQPSVDWLHTFLLREDSLVNIRDPYVLAMRASWQASENWSHRLVGLQLHEAADVVAYIAMFTGV